ncbi:MAG: PQQ-dependent methanol/ethanol family dehydrogenase [Deltaproteobacteria bacterium]|jgi:alcohol dehydrogenase (cytochrome c)|nr:PQQ-dependent methanol/ethanol family dehydrogenase [Deltaproteobacteria bacterium]MBW2519703.1 PQQ-dependent methanol/ethanol family dehydrogenase [Deltaproteobacteria bacterium]
MIALASSAIAAGNVTEEMILNDANTVEDVVSYGMGPLIQRYSPLKQINTETVKKLAPAWTLSYGAEKQRGQEAQPMVNDGKIFVTASYSRVFAADARTGDELWEYNHRLPEGILPCCDVINRGNALYENLVIFGTLDARLVALDRDTGDVVWDVATDDYKAGVSITMAPFITKGGLVMVSNAGSEFGAVGWVKAYDAKTGKNVWERPVIEGHMGTLNGKPNGITGTTNATWPGDLWKTGGGCPWNQGSYDPELDMVYFTTGNPAPWNAYKRPGDNLYTTSILGIDANTGMIKWHYQTVPNDAWDFDAISELLLFDFEMDGKVIKAGAQAHKNGFFYILDRTNGKLLSAEPFVKEINWASGVDMKTGRPIETGNRPGDPAESADGKQGKTVWAVPSFLGGKNWNPMAYNPENGLFYIPATEWGMDIWNNPISYKKGAAYLGAGFTIKPVFDDYMGAMRAFDPKTSKIVWEVKNPSPLWSGALVTAGNLVFYGTPEGYLKALDATTGAELWQYNTGSGVIGSPITWQMDGEQWVAVPSGWGGAVPLWGGEVAKAVKHLNQGGSLWAFKLVK